MSATGFGVLAGRIEARAAARASDYLALAKPRVAGLALATAALGFVLGSEGAPDLALGLVAIAATALVAASSMTLNMVLERDADSRMERTRNRPIPAGRIRAEEALGLGVLLGAGGILLLAAAVNLLTAALAAATLATYLFVYTPLKSRTHLSTLAGAVPGALPVVMGYAAARGAFDRTAAALFLLLFVWQLPHFLAIAWRYRADYARAGYPVLPVVDAEGVSTGRQTVVQTVALVAVSLAPPLRDVGGAAYAAGAAALGAAFLATAVLFAAKRTDGRARLVVVASVLYLPALLAILALGRTLGG